jgi:alpha-glucoside transport system permease protein
MNINIRKLLPGLLVNGTLFVICFVWLVPTLGLLVSSFRARDDIATSGWWTIFPHRAWVKVDEIQLPKDVDRTQPMEIGGVTATFEGRRRNPRRQTPDLDRQSPSGSGGSARATVDNQRQLHS